MFKTIALPALAAIAAVAAAASPASAATMIALSGNDTFGSGTFGATHGTGGFSDGYEFIIPTATANMVGTTTVSFDFGNTSLTSVVLDGTSLDIMRTADGSYSATGSLSAIANPQTLVIGGNVAGVSGSYAGTITYMTGAVPESATWAMMISGFGLVGGALRSRKSKVAFA